ncbi:MAG: hypothetical protein HYV93_11000 [Candidatus Rokubacteria bacterium]|nr:hypothetical protein [Candidatus Rokubacteria bacterium]
MVPATRPARIFTLGLALITAAFLAQAVYAARVLVPYHDETSALFFGYLAAAGEISLYQDDMVGHRPPGAYYVLGATQAWWGRDLLVARMTSVVFGVALVLLTAMLGRRLGGDLCGLLAAAFLAAQGAIVGYYATAHYHALTAMTMVAGLLVWLGAETPLRNVAGAAVLGSLFFLRTHMWLLLPVVLVCAVRRARSRGERLLVGAVMILPPLAFFLWDLRRLKLLASMPFVGQLVRPLGYVPFAVLDARPYQGVGFQLQALVHLARRYEFLVLAVAGILCLALWRGRRAGWRGVYLIDRRVSLLAMLFLYVLACLFVFFRINFKWIGLYIASLAPLLTLVLGYLASRLAVDPGFTPRARMVLAAALAAVLVLPIYYNRNPLLPLGVWRAADPMRRARLAGEHLARLVPREARVFFFGQVDVFYLSGLPPTHLQQIANYDTLAVRDDDNWATMRSGYYGMPQLERWLGVEADYAVISPEGFNEFAEGFHKHPEVNRPKVARMGALLAERFEKVDRVGEYPYYSYEVYRRVGRPVPSVAGGAPPAGRATPARALRSP